ncbi:helix-turn-helix transcriptional regulator [Paenibacillus sp. FSL H7-0940]|uniref:helix-turn-helix domain-containing protein n=1 Tax=Paenibacillus sp. FSL H7-0940 TaxID=2921443 RepID=UPI0030EDA763
MLKVRLQLDKVLSEKDITQTKLSALTGIRQATISDICRNARQEISFPVLEKIATALNITDISKLIQFEEVTDNEHGPDSK